MKVLITWAEVTDREAFFSLFKMKSRSQGSTDTSRSTGAHTPSFFQPAPCVRLKCKTGANFLWKRRVLLKIYVSGTKIQHFIKRVTFKRHWETKSPSDSINEAFWSPPLELDHFGKHVSTFLIFAHFFAAVTSKPGCARLSSPLYLSTLHGARNDHHCMRVVR